MSPGPLETPAGQRLRKALQICPLIAILRGIAPADASGVGKVLVSVGFSVLEVPMNSPQPLESIRALAARHPGCVVGAGTVMTVTEVDEIAECGGRLIVMPHSDLEIVRHARARGLACVPGVATPTEAIAALRAGADALKLFPGEMLGPPVLKAMRAVLPKETLVFPVGGVSEDNMAAFWAAGADGFGIGSALYQPGRTVDDIGQRALRLVNKMKMIRDGSDSRRN